MIRVYLNRLGTVHHSTSGELSVTPGFFRHRESLVDLGDYGTYAVEWWIEENPPPTAREVAEEAARWIETRPVGLPAPLLDLARRWADGGRP